MALESMRVDAIFNSYPTRLSNNAADVFRKYLFSAYLLSNCVRLLCIES